MFESASSFWISLAGFVLAGLWMLGAWAARRRTLGKVLWAAPLPAQRWLAIICLLLAGIKIVEVALGSTARPMGLNILFAGVYLFRCRLVFRPGSHSGFRP